jgi:N-acetyl-alpha-D-muramate 1-phosphate uridylyltransferase
MILAAGRGERMRPLTDTIPKPLVPLQGKPLIQYHVERLAAAGIERIVINLAWLGEQVRQALGDGRRFGVEICYSDEGSRVLDTGGGICRALPLIGARPFWLVAGDVWTDLPFTAAERMLQTGDLAHLIMVDNPDFHPQGDFLLADGRVRDPVGIPTTNVGARLTYASVAVLRPELFADCQPGVFSIVPLLRAAMRCNRVGGQRFTGRWHNIGSLAQLQALESALRTHAPL